MFRRIAPLLTLWNPAVTTKAAIQEKLFGSKAPGKIVAVRLLLHHAVHLRKVVILSRH